MTNRLKLLAGGTCGRSCSPVRREQSVLTTSFGIIRDNTGIIIDHGYGIQNVVPWILSHRVKEVAILQTHYHLDHVVGLPLNDLLFQKKVPVIGIWSMKPSHMDATLAHMFNDLHSAIRPELFSIELPQSRAARHVPPKHVRAFDLIHPGGCLGYRISHPHGDIVIATDHEAGIAPDHDRAFAEFVDGATLLIADVQYRQSEYEGTVGIGTGMPIAHKGWGHSTPEALAQALSFCKAAPLVRVTHHDPMRNSADLGRFSIEAGRLFGSDPCFLYDGEEVVL